MNVPDSLKEKIEQKLQDITDSSRQQAELAKRVKKQKADVEALRRARYVELLKYRLEISNWLGELFFRTEETKLIFFMQPYVNVFSARFWRGMPAGENDVTVCALIQIEPDGGVNYLEKHKGMTSSKLPLGNIHYPSAMSLCSKLHPDFLEQWAAEIKTGKVWQDIENSLR